MLPLIDERAAHGPVRGDDEIGRVRLRRQRHQLRRQLVRPRVLGLKHVVPKHAVLHGKEFGCQPQTVAQFVGPRIVLFDFGRAVADRRLQRHAEGRVQFDLLMEAFGGFRLIAKQLQSAPQLLNRLLEGPPIERPRAGPIPIVDRLHRVSRFGEVAGNDLGLCLGDVRELRFERLADPLMKLLALLFDERVVGRVLDQGVLERVLRARQAAPLAEQVGRDELLQFRLQVGVVEHRDGPHHFVRELAADGRGQLGDLDVDRHPVQPRDQQILQRGGNLVRAEAAR